MAGPRRAVCRDPFETREFARRREKNRARRALAKASGKANRGK